MYEGISIEDFDIFPRMVDVKKTTMMSRYSGNIILVRDTKNPLLNLPYLTSVHQNFPISEEANYYTFIIRDEEMDMDLSYTMEFNLN